MTTSLVPNYRFFYRIWFDHRLPVVVATFRQSLPRIRTDVHISEEEKSPELFAYTLTERTTGGDLGEIALQDIDQDRTLMTVYLPTKGEYLELYKNLRMLNLDDLERRMSRHEFVVGRLVKDLRDSGQEPFDVGSDKVPEGMIRRPFTHPPLPGHMLPEPASTLDEEQKRNAWARWYYWMRRLELRLLATGKIVTHTYVAGRVGLSLSRWKAVYKVWFDGYAPEDPSQVISELVPTTPT